MPSREELELADLRAAQLLLKQQVARLDQQLEQLAARVAAQAAASAPAEPAPVKPPEPIPAAPPASIPFLVPPPLPSSVRVSHRATLGSGEGEALPLPSFVRAPRRPVPEVDSLPPVVAPQPTPPPVPAPPKESFEFRFGTVWLVRIGVVILLTGLVFLGNFAYHNLVAHLGAGGKLALLYLAAGGLAGLGAWIGRGRESMRAYSKVLLAGGAATAYYATYAAHFVERLRVIESPLVGGLALLGMAALVLLLADRQKSEPLALLSVVLAYYTSAINPIGSFTLFSSLVLTAMAVFFLVRHRWVRIPFASLAGTYGSYAYWRFVGEGNVHAALAWHGVAFLAGAWTMYTAAVFVTKRDVLGSGVRVAFLTANNGAFFTGAAHAFAVRNPGDFWVFALGYGAVLLALSLFAWRREADDERLDGAYLAQGLAVVTLGFAAKFTEQRLAMTFAVESVILVTCSRWRHALIYQLAAGLCAVCSAGVAGWYLLDHAAGAVTGALVAALLFADTWLLKRAAKDQNRVSIRALAFALLALSLTAINLWQTTVPAWRGEAFALAVVVCVASIHVLGLLEIAVPGQMLLAGSIAAWLLRRANGDILPWWQPFPSVVVMVGLAAWWKRVSLLGWPGTGLAWLRKPMEPNPKHISSAALVFALLALAVTGTELWEKVAPEWRGEAFALAVVLCVASIHVLRLPEIALPGQILLAGCIGTWVLRRLNGDTLPWWQPFPSVVVMLGLAVWWKRVSVLGLPGGGLAWLRKRAEGGEKRISDYALAFALLALAVTGVELWHKITPDWRGEVFAAAAVVCVASYYVLRLPEIAIPGQVFLAVSLGAWVLRRMNGDAMPWWQPLPLVSVMFGLAIWWKRVALLGAPGAAIAQAYRTVGAALVIAWGFQEIPSPWQPLFFCGLGSLVVLAAAWRRNAEALVSGTVFAVTGSIVFLLREGNAPSGLDLAAILILAGAWRAARMLGIEASAFARHLMPGLVAFNVFLWVTRWSTGGGPLPLTIAWSLLALALFFAGLGLRERTYRLGGLAILALDVGRIFIVDVWRFDTLTRIVSFLVLGAVLMLLGYLYNRFGEKLREWL